MHLLIPDVSRWAWLRVGTPGIRTVPPSRCSGAGEMISIRVNTWPIEVLHGRGDRVRRWL